MIVFIVIVGIRGCWIDVLNNSLLFLFDIV